MFKRDKIRFIAGWTPHILLTLIFGYVLWDAYDSIIWGVLGILSLCFFGVFYVGLKWRLFKAGNYPTRYCSLELFDLERQEMKCQQEDCDGELNTENEFNVRVGIGIGQMTPAYACKSCGRIHNITGRLFSHPSGKIPFLNEDEETINFKELSDVR
jgi:hypothetical protein